MSESQGGRGSGFEVRLEEREFPTPTVSEERRGNESDQTHDAREFNAGSSGVHLLDLFVSKVSRISEVEEIHFHQNRADSILQFWVVICEDELDVRNEIYGIEYDLLPASGEINMESHVVVSQWDESINRIPDSAIELHHRDPLRL